MKATLCKINNIAIILLILLLCSCIKDSAETEVPVNNGNALVTVAIKVPGEGQKPATRGMSDVQENEVKRVDILLFSTDSNPTLVATAYSNTIDDSGSENKIKTITVALPVGEYELVILTNSLDILAEHPTLTGKTKSEVYSLLVKKFPLDGKWATDGTAPFPMWGEVGKVTIVEGLKITVPVQLLRMVARVDVQLNGNALQNFRITSVDVYNHNTAGTLVPDLNSLTVTTEGNKKVTRPNVPSSSGVVEGPVTYAMAPTGITSYLQEIYLFESLNLVGGTPRTPTERTCLVIGGLWDANGNGDFTDDGSPTYYRVDFCTKTDQTVKYWDVLRNHRFLFNITGISGYGHEDSQTAYKSTPINITTEVLAWDDVELNEIVWNGEHQLCVNRGLFEFHGGGYPQTLIIYTDYPDGWKIVDYPTWINIDVTQGTTDTRCEVSITAAGYNNSAPRSGEITIKAGTLTKKIKVTQDNLSDLSIEVIPSGTIQFYKSGGKREVTVNVTPGNAQVTFTPQNPSPIIWEPTGGLPQGGTGSGTYIFEAQQRAGTGTLNASVIVTAKDPVNNNSIQAVINFQQLDTDIVFDFTPWEKYSGLYPAAGHTQGERLFFYALAHRHWKYMSSSPADLFSPKFADIYHAPTDQPKEFEFELEPNTGWKDREIEITVHSTEPDLGERTFTLTQQYTAPFITVTKPAGNTVDLDSDPVINFTTNAKWKFNYTDSYEQVIGSSTPAPGQVSGNSDNSLAEKNGSISFTVKTLTPAPGLPAAGTPIETTIKLETDANSHQPADACEKEVKLKRTVPGFFDDNSVDFSTGQKYNFPIEGRSFTVSATTNDVFTVMADYHNDVTLDTPQPWGERTVTFNVEPNESWDKRDFTVNCVYDGVVKGTREYTQSGYIIYSVEGPQFLSTNEETISIILYGYTPEGVVKARAVCGSYDIESDYLSRAWGAGSLGKATINIPANDTPATREWTFYYKAPTTSDQWVEIRTTEQNSMYWVDPSGHSGYGQVYSKGDVIALTISGHFPSNWVRVRAASSDNSSESSAISNVVVLPASESRNGSISEYASANVTIEPNTGSQRRPVYYQYQSKTLDGWSEWTTFKTASQNAYDPYELPSFRIIAKADAKRDGNTGNENLTWIQAMGISNSIYLTQYYYTSYGGNIDNTGYWPNAKTGCANYTEGGYTWFVPTADEMREMVKRTNEIGLQTVVWGATAAYWTSTEVQAGTAYTGSAQGGLGTHAKNVTNGVVRCVRNP